MNPLLQIDGLVLLQARRKRLRADTVAEQQGYFGGQKP